MDATTRDPIRLAAFVVGVEDAARLLGCDPSQVRRWVADGCLPSVRYPSVRVPGASSRRILIAVADVERFVEAHRTAAPALPNPALSAASVRGWQSTPRRTRNDKHADYVPPAGQGPSSE
jgi:hypothetical protein